MLKTRIKRQTAVAERAVTRLAAVEASVTALADEDLLDLADIFRDAASSPLWDLASAELHRRGLSL